MNTKKAKEEKSTKEVEKPTKKVETKTKEKKKEVTEEESVESTTDSSKPDLNVTYDTFFNERNFWLVMVVTIAILGVLAIASRF